MSTTVNTGWVYQKEVINSYEGGCSTSDFSCRDDGQRIYSNTTEGCLGDYVDFFCTDILQLSDINFTTSCPQLENSVDGSAIFPNSINWAEAPVNNQAVQSFLICNYNLVDFNSLTNVTLYFNASCPNGANPDPDVTLGGNCPNGQCEWNAVMENFCAIPTLIPSNCPIDPATGVRMTACSNMISGGPEGSLCQNWYDFVNTNNPCTSEPSSGIGDRVMDTYCTNYPNNPDCGCLNRVDNKVYQAATNNNPDTSIQDACWWKPCQSKNIYLVTSDFYSPPPACPSTICTTINQNIATNGGSITEGEITTYVSCPTNGGGSTSTFWQLYGHYIIALIIFIVIVITFAILYYIYSNREKK